MEVTEVTKDDEWFFEFAYKIVNKKFEKMNEFKPFGAPNQTKNEHHTYNSSGYQLFKFEMSHGNGKVQLHIHIDIHQKQKQEWLRTTHVNLAYEENGWTTKKIIGINYFHHNHQYQKYVLSHLITPMMLIDIMDLCSSKSR